MGRELTEEEFEEYADKVMEISRGRLQWMVWQLMRSSDKETIDAAMDSAEKNVAPSIVDEL